MNAFKLRRPVPEPVQVDRAWRPSRKTKRQVRGLSRVLAPYRQLEHALREYETFYHAHRPHEGIANARPLAPLPEPITDLAQLAQLRIHRRDRLSGLLHEYQHAA